MAGNKNTKTDKKKKSVGSKKKIVITASLIGLFAVVPIVLLIISAVLHYSASNEFNKTVYPLKYESYVEKYSKEFDVDKCLVYGIIKTESGFDPDAVSPVGAIGLMQIMPDTFTWLQNYRTQFQPDKLLDSDKLFDPKLNIEYGVYLLRYLLDFYDGNVPLVICSYNAGHGNIDEWLSSGIISSDDVRAEDIPFEETANYLTRVQTAMDAYRELYFPDYEYTYIKKETESSEEENTDSDNFEEPQTEYDGEFSDSDEDEEAFNHDINDGYDYNDYNYDDYYYNEGVEEEYY